MNAHDSDRDFKQWSEEWQAGQPRDITTEEQIRHYVKRRGGLMWSFLVADFVITGIALPILAYLSVNARNDVERIAMMSLASITLATIGFSWWNWRGVLRSSAANTAEYLAISEERLRRLRLAWRIAWIVLAGEMVVFVVWIWDHLYASGRAHDAGAEWFAWSWLGGFALVFVVWLLWFGRWITRDAARFEALRRELES
jgi:hypothetical protein